MLLLDLVSAQDARASAHLDDCGVLCCGKIGIKVLSMRAPGASAQLHMQHCSFQRNAISHITCSGAGAEALLEACVLGMGCLTAGLACYDEGRVLASGCFMHSSNTDKSSSSSSDNNQADQPGLICKDSDRQSLCTYARAEDEGSTVQLQGCKLVDNPKMQPPESFQTHEYSFDGAQVIVSGLHKQVGSAAGEDAAGLHGGMRFGQLGICFEDVTSKAWLSLEAAVCSAIMRKSTSWLHEQKDACGYGL